MQHVIDRLATRPSVRRAYGSCHAALRTAVALCQRHSLQAPADTAHELWFGVLEVVVLALRDVRMRHPGGVPATAAGSSSRLVTPLDLESVDARAGVLQQLLTSLMEEAIRSMAGYGWCLCLSLLQMFFSFQHKKLGYSLRLVGLYLSRLLGSGYCRDMVVSSLVIFVAPWAACLRRITTRPASCIRPPSSLRETPFRPWMQPTGACAWGNALCVSHPCPGRESLANLSNSI